jgi:hypothetical protein
VNILDFWIYDIPVEGRGRLVRCALVEVSARRFAHGCFLRTIVKNAFFIYLFFSKEKKQKKVEKRKRARKKSVL